MALLSLCLSICVIFENKEISYTFEHCLRSKQGKYMTAGYQVMEQKMLNKIFQWTDKLERNVKEIAQFNYMARSRDLAVSQSSFEDASQ